MDVQILHVFCNKYQRSITLPANQGWEPMAMGSIPLDSTEAVPFLSRGIEAYARAPAGFKCRQDVLASERTGTDCAAVEEGRGVQPYLSCNACNDPVWRHRGRLNLPPYLQTL
jgi:hypothetical protein